MITTPIPPITPPVVPAQPVPAAVLQVYHYRDGDQLRLKPVQAFDFYPKEKQ
ncbi:hypothetical protein [Rhodoferax koreensis]|uniref:hypothetical protein n=1 Tax=Rhodoferax koreensis TaxID=1842727 RepID=UPI0012FF7494|nr:hypothetical protein [Rhodoferax koreense]